VLKPLAHAPLIAPSQSGSAWALTAHTPAPGADDHLPPRVAALLLTPTGASSPDASMPRAGTTKGQPTAPELPPNCPRTANLPPPATSHTCACHAQCPGDASAVSASWARTSRPCRGNNHEGCAEGREGRGLDAPATASASPAPILHFLHPHVPHAQMTRPCGGAGHRKLVHGCEKYQRDTHLVSSATLLGMAAGWPMPRGCTPGKRSSVSWSCRGCQTKECQTWDAHGISTANGSSCWAPCVVLHQ